MLRLTQRITSSLTRSPATRLLYFKPLKSKVNLRNEAQKTLIQNNQGYFKEKVSIQKEICFRLNITKDRLIYDAKPYINPDLQGLLLSDDTDNISHQKLSKIFDKDDLSSTKEIPKFSVTGMLWGIYLRPIVSMTYSYKGSSINVIFAVCTGSPYTYISASALRTLGVKKGEACRIKINGQQTFISESHSDFADCCVLGALFLFRNKLTLECDYNTLEVNLKAD